MKHPALRTITLACFTISMVAIGAALITSLLLIWTDTDPEITTKAFLTSAAFLGGAAATLVISQVTLGNMPRDPDTANMTPRPTTSTPQRPQQPAQTPS